MGFTIVVCRFCGSDLEALVVEEVVEERYWFDANGYEGGRREVLKREYKCPECFKTLTTDEKDARKLLLKQ
jgi:hypothetical protein